MFKKLTVFLAVLLVSLFVVSFVSAITGSIGNARMVLRVNVGDKIEKSILVKNVNDAPIDIKISASGDLEDYTKVIDNEFRLESDQEKNARFTIDVKKNGTFENKINVMFSPIEKGNGVGLSSTVIIIANGEGEAGDEADNFDQSSNDNTNSDNNDNGMSLTGNVSSSLISPIIIAGLITFIMLIIFLSLLVILYKKSKKPKKKRTDRSS